MTYHLEKAAPGMIVMGMALEVLVKIVDPVGEDGYLDFRGTGIAFASCVFLDDLCFLFCCKRNKNSLLKIRLMLRKRWRIDDPSKR